MTWTLLTKGEGALGVKGETLFLPMLDLGHTNKGRKEENTWGKGETLLLFMFDLELTNKAGEEKHLGLFLTLTSLAMREDNCETLLLP